MGKTAAAGQASKTGGKKPAFQLSKAPLTHGHASPPTSPSSSPATEPSLPLNKKRRASSARSRSVAPASPGNTPAFEDLGSLPTTYNSQSLFLIARDPDWLFCYWDIDWENRPGAPGSRVVLKMFHSAPGKEKGGGKPEAFSTEITPDARDWYIPAEQLTAHTGKNSQRTPASKVPPTLYAEIGYLAPDGTWDAIARSNETTLPAHGISPSLHERFATIPFHLAFQRMQEVVEKTRRSGEPLASALSRIQMEGHHLMIALGKAPSWTPEQRHLLAALLGNELSHLLGMSPEEIDALLREQLKKHLSSARAAVAALEAGEAGGASSLNSFDSLNSFGALRWNALEELSSLSASIDHAFWSSWLSSWKEGALSSFSLPGGEAAGLSSEAALSSALSSWMSSWPGEREAGSSLLSSFLSSWPTAAGASESAFWSSWLSSWSHGAGAAGWGESSGGVSSFNIGASWSAHPGASARSRDFFMHVNAEVIFYGGTHPEATLWVDGKPVPLKPDGSFHFHFKLPDSDTTIPIVAQSPDGQEQRSVSLRLARHSHRRGEIGHTRQPEHLPTLGGSEPIPHGS